MNTRAKGWPAVLFGVAMACATGSAAAAEQPLMVVVEAPPGLELDPGQVRRAIGTELHQAAVAPTRALEDDPGRALIVAVDHDRITMSLRETQASAVTRAIASPADPASRLRVIAWLAGNLARDQVGGLVASPFDPPDAAAAAPSPLPSLPANETPPAAAPQDLAPPPFASPVATVTAQIDPKAARPARWTIGAAAGFGVSSYQTAHVLRQSIFGSWNFTNAAPDIYRSGGTVWRVEARRRGEGTRLFTGLALEGAGNGSEPQVYPGLSEILGAMALVGSAWQLARWSLEADLGAGIDLAERGESVYANTISTSPNGERLYTTSYGSVLRPGLFASASFAAAHPVGDVLDAVATLDVHQSLVDEYDGYFALTLGIRCRL